MQHLVTVATLLIVCIHPAVYFATLLRFLLTCSTRQDLADHISLASLREAKCSVFITFIREIFLKACVRFLHL